MRSKVGLDDYVAAHGPDALRAVIEAAGDPVKPAPADAGESNDSPDDPHLLADKYLDLISPGGGPSYRLRSWRDGWWAYAGGAYAHCPDGDMRANLADWVRLEFVRQNIAAVKAWRAAEGPKSELPPTTYKVTTALVTNVVQALRGRCVLPARFDPPAWIDGGDGPDPSGILPAVNGLLDLEAAALGQPDCLLSPDRQFFTTAAVPFAYDPEAPQPVEWLKFLHSVWPDDLESVMCLQEWFGYLLTADTRQQKILLLLGPKRSGKGTIARVLRELVGPNNVAGPTLGSLATNFGLWPLIGKTVAVVSDARLSTRTDTAVITERLLSISGEDALTIDRKHLTPLTAKLTSRFVILSNEMLRLGDASGALVGRLVVLKATHSYYGREDHGLGERLRAELPGILLWAIQGWRRLRERGRFVQPAAGADLVEAMEDLSSPISAFVRERCVVGAGFQVEIDDLYSAWRSWCEAHGRKEPGTGEMFGRDIRAAVPGVERARPRTPEGRMNVYKGIRLREPSDPDPDDEIPVGGQCWSTSGQRGGQRENAANPSVVNVVNVNADKVRNGNGDTRPHATRTHTPAHIGAMRGRRDHVDQYDARPYCRCGKRALSMTCWTCRDCLDAEGPPR